MQLDRYLIYGSNSTEIDIVERKESLKKFDLQLECIAALKSLVMKSVAEESVLELVGRGFNLIFERVEDLLQANSILQFLNIGAGD